MEETDIQKMIDASINELLERKVARITLEIQRTIHSSVTD